MNSKTTVISMEVIKQNAQQWLQSVEGQNTVRLALQETKVITSRLQEERLVDLKSLYEPFTV